MWPKRKQKTDWMGHYNKLLEEQGELSLIKCVIVNTVTNEQSLMCFDHTQYDGIGSLILGLRKLGFNIPDFPIIKLKKRPHFFQMTYLVLRFIWNELKPVRPISWNYQNPKPPYKTFFPFYHSFDEKMTHNLQKKADELKIKLSSLVLFALNRSVNEILIHHPNQSRWHIPVNMRGFYSGPTKESNHISNYIVQLNAEDSPQTVFQKNLNELKSGSFLATFFMLNFGDFLGMKHLLRQKVKEDYRSPKCSERMTGTFSTVGAWPPKEELKTNPHLMIFPHSNVSLKNPICCVDIVWHEKLCLGLTFHSSIVEDEKQCERVLRKIIQSLEETLEIKSTD